MNYKAPGKKVIYSELIRKSAIRVNVSKMLVSTRCVQLGSHKRPELSRCGKLPRRGRSRFSYYTGCIWISRLQIEGEIMLSECAHNGQVLQQKCVPQLVKLDDVDHTDCVEVIHRSQCSSLAVTCQFLNRRISAGVWHALQLCGEPRR